MERIFEIIKNNPHSCLPICFIFDRSMGTLNIFIIIHEKEQVREMKRILVRSQPNVSRYVGEQSHICESVFLGLQTLWWSYADILFSVNTCDGPLLYFFFFLCSAYCMLLFSFLLRAATTQAASNWPLFCKSCLMLPFV